MKNLLYLLLFAVFLFHFDAEAQTNETSGPVYVDSALAVPSGALSKGKLVAPSSEFKIYNPRNRGINKVVPGKGLPKTTDPALQSKMGEVPSKAPILSYEAVSSRSTPTDPTGFVGPNHYINAWNSAFSIWDKEGNQLMPPASLASIGGEFTGENLGDPIVVYDEFADRYLISQFSDTPESFLIAVSRGPDPLNDGWFTYRFTTNGVLPDYPKISVWGDGYYITTNKNANTAGQSQVIYVVERDKMLQGETAGILAFPLPGIRTNGFYSPAGFHAIGDIAPPRGNSPIVFMQDDAWAGVIEDHLKIWLINVDWNNPASSVISESQRLGQADGVSPFMATFDGGSFSNLSQPGDAPEIDALQATMMYMTQYRRFETHNSVVMNFVVDVDPTAAEHAGIRWYELRQMANQESWTVYQEGTYAPDKSDRFSGSIGIDNQGNIGLGFTILDDSPETPIFPSIRYTGRYAGDDLGIMTFEEQTIVEGEDPDPNSRYGDYAHLSVDPADDLTFWHNAEYFEGLNRKNRVGVFRIAADNENDVGAIARVTPQDATLGTAEEITVRIRNFGSNAQSGFPVSYTVNGGETVTEIFTESIPATQSVNFTFSQPADFSEIGETYEVVFTTGLNNDQNSENDTFVAQIKNLPPRDVGVTSIDVPVTGQNLTPTEVVTVTIENFGGEPQSNFPVSYQVGDNFIVRETFSGTVGVGENTVYTFSRRADLSPSGSYRVTARTHLEEDFNPTNDSTVKSIANLNCIPEGSDCSFGDGIFYFELEEILNERIPCGDGYIDFIGSSATLDRSRGTFTVTVKSVFAEEEKEQFSMWIDLDDDAVFDNDERFVSSQVIPSPNTPVSVDFTIPDDAPLGQHLLRIRAGDTSFEGELNDPCDVMDYGTTHDYSVSVTDSSLNIEDFILNEAELMIISERPKEEDSKIYRARLLSNIEAPLRITVHDMLGQKLLENKMNFNGEAYTYTFDMSYAARGVYLVRVGTREFGKVKRFIVK
ncbi:T9SS type A sorting domain-containing protein [Zunongwangia sp. F260]|uniref:T9SS type A sorting domain-containing protein n=1 Tax=Autumnicola lenta TaxID=3075593 RepID=A0ABU3CKK8_9FLAO|nr:T9SS type A sorting domain-containing protein [Zunongwangia sp. F260]MDT0646856.1 T9SS type A sorting domain-containing protein [Zunongwangia sp. F260]